MIIQLDKTSLYSIFGVNDFIELDLHTQTIAPSMVEYHLQNLISSSDTNEQYINKSNIQHTIYLNEHSLYMDYSDNLFVEFIIKNDEYETQSLW